VDIQDGIPVETLITADAMAGRLDSINAASIECVRAAKPEDARAVSDIYAPYVAETVISFEIDPPDEAQMASRIAAVTPSFPWLIYELDGRPLGYAYASRHSERAAYDWSADAAVYIDRRAHRQGVGAALYAVLMAALRLQGFHTVFGGITLPNPASVGLHEACGFSSVGVYREVGFKFGAWRDVGWWGLQLGAPPPDPQPPSPFTADLLEQAKRLAET
jgi:L-amino acid N-acyltransferase YncA